MYIQRLAADRLWMIDAELLWQAPHDSLVFMFGIFDRDDAANAASALALKEAVLGLWDDDDPIVLHQHHHADARGDGTDWAFMFGASPEQPASIPFADTLLVSAN